MRELNECKIIDCEAAKALAVGLEGNTILKTMNLWDNRLGKEGAIALAEAIKMNNETQLETLNVWGTNKIGNEGAMAFADLLTTNNSLRDLILEYNEIGDEGGDELVDALEQNEGLRNLDLFDYPLDQAIITDVHCLINNPLRCSYEGGLNKDDERGSENASEGLGLDKSCFVSFGGVQGAAPDAESMASPTCVLCG
mmetsp:Transcript_4813/g.7033  ORF Transcript_4813/g.7033 Transcript_4813/m.7033 type:complete len:197 (+) Transcript_4813:225-815(+)